MCIKQSDRKTLTWTLRLNLWVRFPLLLPCILVNRFWRWACWVVSSSLCKATASRGKIDGGTEEWRWWHGYIRMIFLLLFKWLHLFFEPGLVLWVYVPAASFQLSHLTSAIDSHQSVDGGRFTNRSVGMKGAFFFSQKKPQTQQHLFKYFMLIQADLLFPGSRQTQAKYCARKYSKHERQNEMASIKPW